MVVRIALLRGINVGGRNVLPMKALVSILEEQGCSDAKTYIQSGNAVFRYSQGAAPQPGEGTLAARIADAIEARFAFRPLVMVLDIETVEAAMAGNPFADAVAEPRTLHLGFLDRPPAKAAADRLRALAAAGERFELAGRVFYLHAPNGIGRSKLAAGAEGALGARMTLRNWRSVGEIVALAGRLG